MRFLPFQTERMYPFSPAAADVSVVSIAPGVEGLMMPSKTCYSMAVGSEILGISRPPNDLTDIIDLYRCGINVHPDDIDHLVETPDRLESNRALVGSYGANAREAAEKVFSRRINTARFIELIETKGQKSV
jgi:colanic acid biosynthesis glycosyl transferase WcaI